MSLLEEAKALNKKRKTAQVSSEEIELALGWVRDEVTTYQIARVLKVKNGGNVYPTLARALKAYLQERV